MLLHWGILEPLGPSANLSAIRFSSQVRIRSIRVFPTGSRPFSEQPDVVARTEPTAFYLDVYFNAQPVNSTDGKQKQKATNALVPTVLAYPGGQVDFSVDIGAEFSTRLMIIHGDFTSLSIAIYGDLVNELPTGPSANHEAKPLPRVQSSRPSGAMDLCNVVDPTSLGQSLLTLVPGAPSLSLIVRLMLCLKPSNEDWDDPDFPHLYANLQEDFEDFDLQTALTITSRSVSDAVDEDLMRSFADRVANCVGPALQDEAQANLVAKLLSYSAPQHPMLTRLLLESLNVSQIFTLENLEEATLWILLESAANADVARHLHNEPVFDALTMIRDGHGSDAETRKAAKKLCDRIQGWEVLEDALSNTPTNFGLAAAMIKDIALDENSLGIWLQSMITHEDLVDRLADIRVPTTPFSHPPVRWDSSNLSSHEQFIAFLRAFIGVAAVVVVYAWSDSLPVERCRERTLAVLRLWQSIDGYREIVNHLLLLRQMTFRLECMLPLDDDLPSQAGIDSEHILSSLAKCPQSMLRSDFVKVMQSIGPPLTYITDDEVLAIQAVADMAEGGLPSAVKTLTTAPSDSMDSQSVLKLRVALAIVAKELREYPDDEMRLMEVIWEEGYHSLPTYLVDHFSRVSKETHTLFTLTVPSRKLFEDVAALFETSDELLDLLMQLIPVYPLPGRQLAALTCSVADLFVCTDSADMVCPQESSACSAACAARQSCVNTVVSIVTPSSHIPTGFSSSVLVLRTLLEQALSPGNHEAIHHISQIFWLFDHALPQPSSESWSSPMDLPQWVRQVIPSLLGHLGSFFTVLELENKMRFFERLINLDDGVVGVGEWLLLEELNQLSETIAAIGDPLLDNDMQLIGHWRISASLRVFYGLLHSSSSSSTLCIDSFASVSDAGMILAQSFTALLDQNLLFSSMDAIALSLSSHCARFSPELRLTLLKVLLRAIHSLSLSAFEAASHILEHLPSVSLDAGNIRDEAGEALEAVAEVLRSGDTLLFETAETLLRFMQWFVSLKVSAGSTSLPMRNASLEELFVFMAEAIPPINPEALHALRSKLDAAEERIPVTTVLPLIDSVEMPLGKWEEILSPPVPVPSTPSRRSPGQSEELLGLVTLSPPNALLRSPEVKGLTKTYSNNDFRQLRQTSAVRQNTSRLPSMHVDDFEIGTSSSPPASLPVHTPPGPAGSPANPFNDGRFTNPRSPTIIPDTYF